MTYFTLSGALLSGTEQIASFFSEAFSGPYKGSLFQLKLTQIRFLNTDIAFVDGVWKVSGPSIPQNYPAEGLYSQVLQYGKNNWKIASARPTVPLQGIRG